MDQKRQELLTALAEFSDLAPEVRSGQLIANLSYLARGATNESIWDAEDEELVEATRQLLEQFRTRRGAAV